MVINFTLVEAKWKHGWKYTWKNVCHCFSRCPIFFYSSHRCVIITYVKQQILDSYPLSVPCYHCYWKIHNIITNENKVSETPKSIFVHKKMNLDKKNRLIHRDLYFSIKCLHIGRLRFRFCDKISAINLNYRKTDVLLRPLLNKWQIGSTQ